MDIKKGRVVMSIALAFLIVIFATLIVSARIDVKKQEKELQQLQETCSKQVEENEELEYLLSEENRDELLLRSARKAGYIFPDERVYIDAIS